MELHRSFSVRQYEGAADAQRIAELINDSRGEGERQDHPVSAERVRALLQGTSSDPRSDVHLFFRGELLVAYERTRRETWASGARVYHASLLVRAGWRSRQTLVELLAHVCEYHAAFARHDASGAIPFLSIVPDPSDVATLEVLLSAGFEPCHSFLSMRRPLDQDVAARDLPPHLEVRLLREADYRSIYAFDRRIMRDGWGVEAPTEAHFAWWAGEAFRNPELWRVAWHGDTIVGTAAGIVGGTWNPSLGGDKAEIRFVRVEPAWRRRGIAGALILQCLAALWERGIRQVELGVDGDNETTAAALYRSLGFEVTSRIVAYRRDVIAPESGGDGPPAA